MQSTPRAEPLKPAAPVFDNPFANIKEPSRLEKMLMVAALIVACPIDLIVGGLKLAGTAVKLALVAAVVVPLLVVYTPIWLVYKACSVVASRFKSRAPQASEPRQKV